MVNRESLILTSELVAGIEFRFCVSISNLAPYCHCYLRFLDHASEIPGIAVFIGRLMIVCRVVSAKLLFAPTLRSTDVIISFLQTDRWHTHLREREMVGTEERSLFRSRVWRNFQALLTSNRLHNCL